MNFSCMHEYWIELGDPKSKREIKIKYHILTSKTAPDFLFYEFNMSKLKRFFLIKIAKTFGWLNSDVYKDENFIKPTNHKLKVFKSKKGHDIWQRNAVCFFVFLLTFKNKRLQWQKQKKEINGENAELGRVSKYIVYTVKPWDT